MVRGATFGIFEHTNTFVQHNILFIFSHIHEKFVQTVCWFVIGQNTCCQNRSSSIVKHLNIGLTKNMCFNVSFKKTVLWSQSLTKNLRKTKLVIKNYVERFFSFQNLTYCFWEHTDVPNRFFFHSQLLVCHELKPFFIWCHGQKDHTRASASLPKLTLHIIRFSFLRPEDRGCERNIMWNQIYKNI